MTDLLHSLIASAFGEAGALIVRYTDLGAVEHLWSFISEERALPNCDVVLLYDGQGDSTSHPFRPENWLTPWDWAMAIGVVSGQRGVLPPDGLRCWIVDLLPSGWGTAGRNRFKTVGALTPWVRWYRPVVHESSLAHNTTALFEDISRRAAVPTLSSKTISTDSIALTRAWTTLMAAPADRHAIGNVIGPIMLKHGLFRRFGETLELTQESAQRRVQALIEALGLVGSRDERMALSNADNGAPLTTLREGINAFRSLKILLVDDQYEYGFHSVLSHVVLGSTYESVAIPGAAESRSAQQPDIRVVSLSNPVALVSGLRDAITSQSDWSRPRVLARDHFDILCLDLRLFPDSTIHRPSRAERDFLTELLRLCEDAKAPVDTDRPLATAIEAAARRCAGGSEELQSLCLLPLLINRIDPSLPIVLFSSTHQREIVDLFRDAQSIITTFSKPIVTGHASADVAIRSAEDLVAALRRAVQIRSRRGVWIALEELSRAVGPAVQIQELHLRARDESAGNSYSITADTIRLLSSEFQRLFPDGRFADALQLPDNVLEQVGAKYDVPLAIGHNMDVFAVYALKGPGSWDDAIRASYDLSAETRTLARNLVKKSLLKMSCDGHLKDAVAAIAEYVGRTDLQTYDPEKASLFVSPTGRREIRDQYGSIAGVIAAALDERLRTEEGRLRNLNRSGHAIAAFQFYSIPGAMRNGRSHFRIRPGDREHELEKAIGWLWIFFLEGLTVLARGGRPIHPGRLSDITQLSAAAKAQWWPGTRFIDRSEGEAYCSGVITRFGHLLEIGALRLSNELSAQGEYARYLAAGNVRSTLATEEPSSSPELPVDQVTQPQAKEMPRSQRASHKTRPVSAATYRPFEEKLRGFKV